VMEFLRHIPVLPVDVGVADVYGRLKAAILDHYGPREKARRRRTDIRRLGFTENDLWIAAVARHHGCTIVSADSDFGRIAVVEELAVEDWST
jgi:tRNA(fMet)-specific endonuclease VapC